MWLLHAECLIWDVLSTTPPSHPPCPGGVSNTWTIISLLSDQPILHGPLDVGAIIEYLVQQHLIDSRLWIANFELGDEVQRGAGMTVIRNYAVTVE